MRWTVAVGAALVASASAHGGAPAETITYRMAASGFCLACSSYTIVLHPDGSGVFVGGRGAAVRGLRRFRASAAAARAFAARLRPYRPAGERLLSSTAVCASFATDQDSIDVRWQAAGGRPAHLDYYLGCDMDRYRAMTAALASAPGLLPIAAFIGKR